MKTLELKPLSDSIQAKISIPGSKSYTNRALLLAALSGSQVKLFNPLLSDDTKAMICCLKSLGIKVIEKEDSLIVFSKLKSIQNRTYELNADLSGTTIRFILALSTIIPGTKILTGKEGLKNRPIAQLVNGLAQLGANIEYLDKSGYPPIRVSSSRLNKNIANIKGSISSQYISSLLMIGPVIGGLTIKVKGKQVSRPYIDMTIDTMKHFGVKVINENYKKYIINSDQKYKALEYRVEGDLSSAGYFLAIAALTESKITIEKVNPHSKQADREFIKILEQMGNKVSFGKSEVMITGTGIKPVNVNMQDCPDQIQTMAVLAAFANGISKISGISSLRIKETDRAFALREELKKMGIKTSATKDTLVVHGGNPKAATVETYGDHRMAMSFAVAGSKISGMRISDPEVVNKTFPEFFKVLNSIGIKNKIINTKNIVLIGMRGSGKTTVAKILSRKLNKPYFELDEMLAKQTGMSISQIVEKFGWEFFRDKESEIVKQISKSQDVIISTGGGVITRSENIKALRKNGILVYLDTPLQTLTERVGEKIGKNPEMPALTDKKDPKAEIAYVLSQREKLYNQAAHKMLLTNNLRADEIADKIVETIKEDL